MDEPLAKKQRVELASTSERKQCARNIAMFIDITGMVYGASGSKIRKWCRISHKRIYIDELKYPEVAGRAEWVPLPGYGDYEISHNHLMVKTISTGRYIKVAARGDSGAFSVLQLLEEAWMSKNTWWGFSVFQQAKAARADLDFEEDEVFNMAPDARACLAIFRYPTLLINYCDFRQKVGLLLVSQERMFLCIACKQPFLTDCDIIGSGAGQCNRLACVQARTHGKTCDQGVSTEQAVKDMLMQLIAAVVDAQRSGHVCNGQEDVIVTLRSDNSRRLVQVKTLLQQGSKAHRFTIAASRKYNDKMLVLAVNKQQDHFFVCTGKELPVGNTSITFSRRARLWMENKFVDKTAFLLRVTSLLETTLEEKDLPDVERYSPKTLLELQSRRRLRQLCENLGFTMEDHQDASSAIDMRINGYNVQHKSSAHAVGDFFTFPLQKLGKGQYITYDIADNIDFFCFEISLPLYAGRFMMVPVVDMLAMGYVSDYMNNKAGRHTICIPRPDYTHPNTLLNYCDNLHLLRTPKVQEANRAVVV